MKRYAPRKARKQKIAGAALLGVGLLLLAFSGVYYAYGFIAKSNLDELRYAGERPPEADLGYAVSPPGEDGRTASSGGNSPLNAGEAVLASGERLVIPAEGGALDAPQEGKAGENTFSRRQSQSGEGSDSPQPGEVVAVDGRSGGAALAGSESGVSVFTEAELANTTPEGRDIGGLEAVPIEEGEPGNQGQQPPVKQDVWRNSLIGAGPIYLPPGAFGPMDAPVRATRMRIPAIGVDSEVKDLAVVHLSESSSWETPNNVVGHIPTTARPAGEGEGWYFGHLESPIKGEGNVFLRLPEIPRLLRLGEKVYIYLEDSERKYKYEVYLTDMIPQEELRITDSGQRDITLVTCYPRFIYDQRLLVTAALVGIAEIRAIVDPERDSADP